MHRSVSLFASIALHAAIILVAMWAFHTVRTFDHNETKIRISLLTPLPTSEALPTEAITTPPPMPQSPPKKAPEKPVSKSEPRIIETHAPVVPPATQPEPAKFESVKTVAPAVPAVPVAPGATVSSEPLPRSAPPPPPVNIQAKYEEENLGRIRTILAERLTYPKNALRLRQQGEVIAVFSLSPSGEVSNLAISKSSDFELLDSAALRLIESAASEFPKPAKTVRITVPIAYKIR